ncbi:MAG: tRNA 2-thiouridine(34) synthase MnmA [Clostridia bacterium]|nr:tRNA 2-thiouridine(34) synthase MnmA [Clostridia bacterium]
MRIVLGLSGGVDSSVAGYLLKQQGHEVIGVFMKNWEEKDENGRCTSDVDYLDAQSVAGKLKIPFYSVNYSKEYYDRVFTYFLDEYKKGRTPNPDVLCNREIKFGPFLDFAKKLGADKIATGHYCKTVEKDGLIYLAKPKDLNKDQTYFLNQLSYEQLSSVIFPLEDVDKPTVRKIAEELELSTAKKKDSTGICFIGERNFRNFLSNYLPNQKGDIKTTDGVKVGEHIGLMYYTIGQRKGLDIGGVKGFENGRWFVVEKDLKNNVLIVETNDESKLYSSCCVSNDFHFITKVIDGEFNCQFKCRYRQEDAPGRAVYKDGKLTAYFDEPQRAITEGQYLVVYDNDGLCLGGGAIDVVIK